MIPEHIKKEYTPLPSTGVIVRLGEEVDTLLTPLREGTMVMFSKYSGTDASVDTEHDFRILDITEILCTLVDTEEVVTPVLMES